MENNNNIIGIGTDVVNISRIEAIFQKYGDKFLSKNFHTQEIENFKELPQPKKIGFLAKRFAGKEAIAKALGKGIGRGLAFKDIAILNDVQGAPYVLIDSENSTKFSKYNIHISLADDYPFAVAYALITM